MNKEITKEIAQKFLGNANPIDLDEFAHELLAAMALDNGWLPGGLDSLSDRPAHIALASIQAEGDSLYLQFKKLTNLSAGAAAALARFRGKLWFDSLEVLSDGTAEALSQHQGELGLPAIKDLSDAAAAALAKHKGEINLNGLTRLSDAPSHVALAEALARENSGGILDLCDVTSLSDNAAAALANHKGELRLFGLKKLTDQAIAALAKHKDVGFLSDDLQTAVTLARKAKPAGKGGQPSKPSQVNWDAKFLKQVQSRWKRQLLIKDDFKTPEELLNAMISDGKSVKKITEWMEANDICSGGDAACQKAVEFGWLVGAWDVSYNTLLEAQESQNPDQLVAEGAEIVAEALKG